MPPPGGAFGGSGPQPRYRERKRPVTGAAVRRSAAFRRYLAPD